MEKQKQVIIEAINQLMLDYMYYDNIDTLVATAKAGDIEDKIITLTKELNKMTKGD